MSQGFHYTALTVAYRALSSMTWQWESSFNEALQESRSEGLPVLLVPYASAVTEVVVLAYDATSHGSDFILQAYTETCHPPTAAKQVALMACGLSDVDVSEQDVGRSVPSPPSLPTHPFRFKDPIELRAGVKGWLSFVSSARMAQQTLGVLGGPSSGGLGGNNWDGGLDEWPGSF